MRQTAAARRAGSAEGACPENFRQVRGDRHVPNRRLPALGTRAKLTDQIARRPPASQQSVHAACDQVEGLPAALRILGWEGAHVEFVSACRIKPTMALPIAELLLESALLHDRPQEPPQPQEPWYD